MIKLILCTALRIFIGFAPGLGLVSCSSPPMEFHYLTASDYKNPVWPAPPEQPHFMYVGQLKGEDNLRPVTAGNHARMDTAIRWITGLGFSRDAKVTLVRPQCGAVGPNGRIFITDVGNNSIFVFDPINGVLDVWKDADWSTPFISPIGIVALPDGRVLVADSGAGFIYVLDSTGAPLSKIGEHILKRPTGLAFDIKAGEIYVADTEAQDIKVFDLYGQLVRTIGSPGTGNGEFNRPSYLAFKSGKLYVTDTLNARIQVFSSSGDFLSIVGGRGLYVGNLTHPKGVAVDSDENIYVIESFYDYLLIFNPQGKYLMPIGGSGQKPGKFFLPAGIWIDGGDRIYIADMFNARVMVFQYLGG